jgi:hypothetical protein
MSRALFLITVGLFFLPMVLQGREHPFRAVLMAGR